MEKNQNAALKELLNVSAHRASKPGSESVFYQDIKRLREIISYIIECAEDSLTSDVLKEDCRGKLWDEKDSILGVIAKLTPILIKLIPVEQQLAKGEQVRHTGVSDEDRDILKRYVTRCIERGDLL